MSLNEPLKSPKTINPSPPVTHSSPLNGKSQHVSADSDSPTPQITPQTVEEANTRLSATEGVRPKRKYTKRGTANVVAAPAVVDSNVVPVSLEEAKALLQLPFNELAKATEFPGFRLSDSKLDECAPLMDKVLKKYLPAMEGEHSAAIALGIALGAHLLVSGLEYRRHNIEIEALAREKQQQKAIEHAT